MSAWRRDRVWMHRRPAGERGGVVLLTALLLPVVLGFAGAAVDVGNAYTVRSMLQHAVDDGALSAERWSTAVADGSGASAPAVLQAAVSEALVVAHDELASVGLAASTVTATPSGAGLALSAEARVPTFFLGVFGIPLWTVVARADAPWWTAPVIASGTSGGTAGGDNGPADLGASPDSTGDAPDPASGEMVESVGPCNCDSIAAGDPASAAAALESMGATPTNPGPFAGDLTAAMGFGAMQSSPETDTTAASDGSADVSSDATDGSSDMSAGDASGDSSSGDSAGDGSGNGSDGGGDGSGGGDGGDGF